MKFIDPEHPFFAPVWRRWLTCLGPVAWGAVELYSGHPGWALLFAGAGAYAGYSLILARPKS